MKIEELLELSDVEKWDWILENINLVNLNDEDEVYFTIVDEDGNDDFEINFNEPLEMDEGLASLFKAIGFESNNY